MTYKGIFFEREDGKRYIFTFNAQDDLVAGTTVLSGRKRPISASYNGQYKASATGEVIVLQDSQIVAVLEDFDADFELIDAGLNPIQVKDMDGNADLVYVADGEGLLNIGTEVFDDPAGMMPFADAMVTMGNWKITFEGGVVMAAEQVEPDPEDDKLSELVILAVDEEGKPTGDKVLAYVKGSAKLILVVGTPVYADKAMKDMVKDGIYTIKETYFISIKKGVVADVNKEFKPVRK